MLKFEKKLIEWLNRHMIFIALVFVILAAGWMRLAGRNFIGTDYHYSLYDIPGNCSSVLYRLMIRLFMKTDYVVVLVKLLAYAGDFGVALLTFLLVHKENQRITDLRTFLTVTACLLSPVVLIYGIGGMEIDSVCMCFLLLGLWLYKKAGFLPAVLLMMPGAFLYTAYWPVVIGVSIYLFLKQGHAEESNRKMLAGMAALGLGFLLSVFIENAGLGYGYYWVKLFVVNPETGVGYENPLQYFLAMVKIYGYFAATGSMLISFRNKKWRVPALVLQVLVLMYVGWNMTAHLAV